MIHRRVRLQNRWASKQINLNGKTLTWWIRSKISCALALSLSLLFAWIRLIFYLHFDWTIVLSSCASLLPSLSWMRLLFPFYCSSYVQFSDHVYATQYAQYSDTLYGWVWSERNQIDYNNGNHIVIYFFFLRCNTINDTHRAQKPRYYVTRDGAYMLTQHTAQKCERDRLTNSLHIHTNCHVSHSFSALYSWEYNKDSGKW